MHKAVSIIFAISLFVPIAYAADDDKEERFGHHKRMTAEEKFNKIDTNGDQIITLTEFTAAYQKRIDKMKDRPQKNQKLGMRTME